jgi:hypothetical protein
VTSIVTIGCAIGLFLGGGLIRYDQPPAPPTETRLAEAPAVRTANPPDSSTSSEPGPVRRSATGIASTYGPGFAGYLALPEGPGIRVRICGPAACAVRVSNDAGPSLAMQRKGRIADLDVATFELVSGKSWRAGLVRVTVEYL